MKTKYWMKHLQSWHNATGDNLQKMADKLFGCKTWLICDTHPLNGTIAIVTRCTDNEILGNVIIYKDI